MKGTAVDFNWTKALIEIAIIVVLTAITRAVLIRVVNKAIDRAVNRTQQDTSGRLGAITLADPARQAHRTKTLGSVLRSVIDIVLILTAVFMILRALDINVAPAIASAGIGGIAIGFGAQSLIKDVISGIFLLFEDQFGVGDFITVGDISGTVTNISLRVTTLQDAGGKIWYIRNGEITTLGNTTQGWSCTLVSFPVNLSEEPFQVIRILDEVCEEFSADPTWRDKVLEPPSTLGISAVTDFSATYSISVKCRGNEQWAVERELRARVLQRFTDDNISGPATPLAG